MFSCVLSICLSVDAFSVIFVWLQLFGVLFIVCPCAMLVCVLLWLFISVSCLLLSLSLSCTICWESDSYCFNILSRGCSICWVSWSLRYCSAVIGIALMCLLFLVMTCPVFVTLIVQDLLLWLWLPVLITVPWVQGTPSSLWTTTVEPVENKS